MRKIIRIYLTIIKLNYRLTIKSKRRSQHEYRMLVADQTMIVRERGDCRSFQTGSRLDCWGVAEQVTDCRGEKLRGALSTNQIKFDNSRSGWLFENGIRCLCAHEQWIFS
jgi:hypothetical protein